jgi:WD40-like Beta Propeller Repeat
VVSIDAATGVATPLPLFDDAWGIGPGGRSILIQQLFGNLRFTFRGPDGRPLSAHVLTSYGRDESAVWSADGTRFAIATGSNLKVMDTATGATVARLTIPGARLEAQAFAPDGSALLVESGPRVLRVDLASGTPSVVLRASRANDWPIAAWGASGNVAASLDGRGIKVFGPSPADERLSGTFADRTRWSPDGSALAYLYNVPSAQRCAAGREGLSLLVPGAAPRPLLAPSDADLVSAIWAPDGRTLAVQADGDWHAAPEPRGKRHPWPKHIRREYGMFSAAETPRYVASSCA